VSTGSGPVSAKVLDETIAWQLRLGNGEGDTQQQAELQQWLAANPEHARAWNQLSGIDRQLGTIDSPVARRALQRPAVSNRRTVTNRALFSLVLLAAASIGLALQTQPLAVWLADERTGAGEQLSMTLPDNSRIQLNSHSAIDVHFDPDQRTIGIT
jgi:transmembrane sensor